MKKEEMGFVSEPVGFLIDGVSYELSGCTIEMLPKAIENFGVIEKEIKNFKDYEDCLEYYEDLSYKHSHICTFGVDDNPKDIFIEVYMDGICYYILCKEDGLKLHDTFEIIKQEEDEDVGKCAEYMDINIEVARSIKGMLNYN